MFGPSAVFDLTKMDASSLRNNGVDTERLFGACTPSFPFKFDFTRENNGHWLMVGPTGEGMSCRNALPLFAQSGFLALDAPAAARDQ